MTDVDGKSTYSPTISINNPAKKTVLTGVYPTVVNKQALLGIMAARTGKYKTVITDLNGKTISTEILQLTEGSNIISRDFSNLAKGTYFVSIYDNGTAGKAIEFIRQ